MTTKLELFEMIVKMPETADHGDLEPSAFGVTTFPYAAGLAAVLEALMQRIEVLEERANRIERYKQAGQEVMERATPKDVGMSASDLLGGIERIVLAAKG